MLLLAVPEFRHGPEWHEGAAARAAAAGCGGGPGVHELPRVQGVRQPLLLLPVAPRQIQERTVL